MAIQLDDDTYVADVFGTSSDVITSKESDIQTNQAFRFGEWGNETDVDAYDGLNQGRTYDDITSVTPPIHRNQDAPEKPQHQGAKHVPIMYLLHAITLILALVAIGMVSQVSKEQQTCECPTTASPVTTAPSVTTPPVIQQPSNDFQARQDMKNMSQRLGSIEGKLAEIVQDDDEEKDAQTTSFSSNLAGVRLSTTSTTTRVSKTLTSTTSSLVSETISSTDTTFQSIWQVVDELRKNLSDALESYSMQMYDLSTRTFTDNRLIIEAISFQEMTLIETFIYPKLFFARDVYFYACSNLTHFRAPRLIQTNRIEVVASKELRSIDLQEVVQVFGDLRIRQNARLDELKLFRLTGISIAEISDTGLSMIELPNLKYANTIKITANQKLRAIDAPALSNLNTMDLTTNDELLSINFPKLQRVAALKTANTPKLTTSAIDTGLKNLNCYVLGPITTDHCPQCPSRILNLPKCT
eukprot:m.343178 g.343178  ORF g.343178 m.343178 type:complete len:469 (+) comp22440_c0_seq1:53-1459(+)